MAADLHVTIPAAGMLVSGYALAVTFGAPILAIATARMPRRAALLGLIGIFLLGNLLCAIAPGYWTLMAARVVTAFCHGAFFGLGAVVAAQIVPPNRRAQAIALMFSGLTLANVLGVPAGTALGQALGWRATFWAVVAIGIVAALALARWLPRIASPAGHGILREFRALGRTQVMLAMAISTLSSASLFSVFTYIAPMLREVTGVAPSTVTLVLLVFGIGLTLGNLLGGRLGDWRLMPVVIALFIAIAAVLALLPLAMTSLWAVTRVIFLWGVLVFALISPLQLRVVTEATHAPNLASTLNQGAFNFGNASGAWISGVALTHGVGYATLPWIGVAIAVAALGLTILSHALDRRPAGLVAGD